MVSRGPLFFVENLISPRASVQGACLLSYLLLLECVANLLAVGISALLERPGTTPFTRPSPQGAARAAAPPIAVVSSYLLH